MGLPRGQGRPEPLPTLHTLRVAHAGRKGKKNMRNLSEIKKLFEREAVLFGARDGVPEYRAVQLLGADAVEFAKRLPGGNSNGYGIGDYTAYYLTESGFYAAATYRNVKEIKQEEHQYGGTKA